MVSPACSTHCAVSLTMASDRARTRGSKSPRRVGPAGTVRRHCNCQSLLCSVTYAVTTAGCSSGGMALILLRSEHCARCEIVRDDLAAGGTPHTLVAQDIRQRRVERADPVRYADHERV